MIGDPKDPARGTALSELACVRTELQDSRDMLEALNRTIERRRQDVLPDDRNRRR